jgi:hypothetical protein
MMTRRQAIKTTALAGVALTTLSGAIAQTNFSVPRLPCTKWPVHPTAVTLRL